MRSATAPLRCAAAGCSTFPGMTPMHPRRYRELVSQGRRRAGEAISGYGLALTPKATALVPYGWHDQGEHGWRSGRGCRSRCWSGRILCATACATGHIAATYLQLLRTAWVYISSGALCAD